jgi:aminoglycoside 6'-N-acetyltransferase I
MKARVKCSIEEIKESSLDELTAMVLKLWPECSYEDEWAKGHKIWQADNQTVFLAKKGDHSVGFIELSIRTDYVEGTTTSPVAYIEGLYVEPGFRKQGIAEELVKKAEAWGLSRNCTEIASDAELTNAGSIAFHQALGFSEANRVVCFVKPMNSP